MPDNRLPDKFAYDINSELPTPDFHPKGTEDWEYVTVPETNILDEPHQGAAINAINFSRGRTYLIHPDAARELARILKRYEAQNIRILQPKSDLKALTDLK